MDADMVDVCGEITALRFILSVMLANDLLRMPDAEQALVRLASDVDRKLRFKAHSPEHANARDASAIQDAAIAAARRFFEATADRYGEIS